MLDVVIPVYNEEKYLLINIPKLYSFLEKNFREFKIIIADNASTDNTPRVSKNLLKKYSKIKYLRIEEKGRGGAIKRAWGRSKSEYLTYMDVDLSTDLNHLITMVELLNNADIVYGSRLEKTSKVKRSLHREILSRGYNLLIRLFFNTKIKDFQCGFKGIKRNVAKKLIPLIENNDWFFDTELLLLAEKKNYKVKPVSVNWVEGKNSKVKIIKTVLSYLKEIIKMKLKSKYHLF